jgi:ACS family tartrate transporter-like MFS transporter
MILYLTYWFPQAYLARYIAMFQTAIPLASVIGGPLASVILGMEGIAGLHGWQWLFILEGMPAVVAAFAVLKLLSDGPAQATWLTIEEKTVIADRIARDQTTERRSFWLSLRDPRVLTMGLVLFGVTAGGQYGVGLWLPQIVQRMGFSNQETGFIVALPYIVAVPTMILWGRSSDLRRERVWHIAIPLLLGSGCFAVASVTQDNLVEFVALAITAIVAITSFPPMNSLVKSMLSGSAAASGVALYNSVGNLGGFAGPYIIGALQKDDGSNAASMAVLATLLLFSACLVLALGRVLAAPPAPARPEVRTIT